MGTKGRLEEASRSSVSPDSSEKEASNVNDIIREIVKVVNREHKLGDLCGMVLTEVEE